MSYRWKIYNIKDFISDFVVRKIAISENALNGALVFDNALYTYVSTYRYTYVSLSIKKKYIYIYICVHMFWDY